MYVHIMHQYNLLPLNANETLRKEQLHNDNAEYWDVHTAYHGNNYIGIDHDSWGKKVGNVCGVEEKISQSK